MLASPKKRGDFAEETLLRHWLGRKWSDHAAEIADGVLAFDRRRFCLFDFRLDMEAVIAELRGHERVLRAVHGGEPGLLDLAEGCRVHGDAGCDGLGERLRTFDGVLQPMSLGEVLAEAVALGGPIKLIELDRTPVHAVAANPA